MLRAVLRQGLRRSRWARASRAGHKIFLLLALVPLLCVFPYIGAVNNPNENVRTYMTMALVEEGTLRIDTQIARYGWVNDMAVVPSKTGPHHYSVKAPYVSLVAVPFYWLQTKLAPMFGKPVPTDKTPPKEKVEWMRLTTWLLRLGVVQIPCALFVLFLERYLRSVTADPILRYSAVAAALLGTNYVAYTNIFASHALCGVAAFLAFALVEAEHRLSRGDATKRRWWVALLAGLATGATVLLEYHAIAMAIVLALWGLSAFWRPTRLLAFGAGGAVNAAALMLFQWKAYGNPLTPGHKMVESAEFAAQHAQGLFGIMVPTRVALEGLSFDVGSGFFGTSPFMWLGFLALPFGFFFSRISGNHARRTRRRALFVCFLTMVGLWTISAGFLHWRGGWTIGPRYLAAAPPFFAFAACVGLEHVASWNPSTRIFMRGVASGLACASVLTIGLVGIVYDTLPENYSRPLLQFAVPMIRAGFVPHHVGEWFGWTTPTFFYGVAACLLLAPLLVAFAFDREAPKAYAMRVLTAAVFGVAAMAPTFAKPEGVPPDIRQFMAMWEPPERDRITQLRIEAERRGRRGPCYWYRLADLERSVDLLPEATRDEARAGAPRTVCPRRWIF